jgi:hypothetical protein
MAIETLAAVAIAISVGVLGEWLLYLQLSATVRAPLALAPFAISVLTFLFFPMFRWTRQKAPIGGNVLFALIGLVATIAGSAILMIMVGCHFGECINL